MTQQRNALRLSLAQRDRLPLGTWVKLPAIEVVELLAAAGLDFIVIDFEHAPLSLQKAHDMIGVARHCGITPIVRLPEPSVGLAQRVLDAGAHGIMFAHVDTVEDAERIARITRFPPRGTRGVGSTSRAGEWGLGSRDEYLRFGREEVLIIAQLESAVAVAGATEIGRVDGIDALFVGEADLAMSEGLPPGDPRLTRLVASATAQAAALPIPIGNAGGAAPESVRAAIAAGFTFTMLSNDATMLGAAARAAVAAAGEVGNHVG